MEVKAGYEEGHLVVAAVRVLSHQHSGKPPTVKEISKLLQISFEWCGVLVAALERAGVIQCLTGPFETRIEILDHTGLEDLPRGDSASTVDEELREFSAKKEEEEEKLMGLFASGDALKKQQDKMGKMAEHLKRFKPKDPKPSPLFKDSPSDQD